MYNAGKQIAVQRLNTGRRNFLKMLALSLTGAALAPLVKLTVKKTAASARTEAGNAATSSDQRQVFIFQDRAHFDARFNISGQVEPYQAPKVVASTRAYVNKTDELTFLQRHWFV